MNVVKWIGVGVFTVLVLGLVVLPLALKGWHSRWGATDAEAAAQLPGDELVPEPAHRYTRAITIDAPPEEVWPWLVQTGYQRAGWYTYDGFYKATGSAEFVDGHSSDRIVPELQDLKVGDKVHIAKPIGYHVVEMEAPRYMVWHGSGVPGKDMPGSVFARADAPEKYASNTWVYVLKPVDGGKRTRLVMRMMGWTNDKVAAVFGEGPFELGGFVMARKHLLGVKARAEAGVAGR